MRKVDVEENAVFDANPAGVWVAFVAFVNLM